MIPRINTDDLQKTRWCNGLKSSGYRILQPDEIDRLRRITKSALTGIWKPATVLVACPSLLYVSATWLGDGPDSGWIQAIIFGFSLAAAIFILPASALLMTRDIFKKWNALRVDLRESRVECFATDASPSSQAEISNVSKIVSTPTKTIEVLPRSGLIFLLDGIRTNHESYADITEAVAPPESASLYAIPHEWASGIAESKKEQSQFERRRLTSGELDELAQHLRWWRPHSWAVLGFAAIFVMFLIAGVLNYVDGDPKRANDQSIFSILLVAGTSFFLLRSYVRGKRASNRLSHDHASAWVVVVEPKDGSQDRQEVLPISGAVWTINGQPSGWRLIKTETKNKK